MNFREELRNKKYEIKENEDVENVLKKLLAYFKESYFKKGNFSAKKVHFKYQVKLPQGLITCEIGHDKIFEYRTMLHTFCLLKEKFIDEGYIVEDLGFYNFSVIIKP